MITNLFDDRLIIKSGDLTDERVDVIVNAANWTLLGGGGVDGAIHRRGGPAIIEACREIRRTQYPDGLPTGEAVITTGGDLPAKYVIHTVGPIYGQNDGRDAELLAACYRNAIDLARSSGLSTLAFPSISTGAFGYPKHEAAPIVWETLQHQLTVHEDIRITLVFYAETDARQFVKHRQ